MYSVKKHAVRPSTCSLVIFHVSQSNLMRKSSSYRKLCVPYEKKVLVSIGSNTFFALRYSKFAKKVLDPILTNTFFFIRGARWKTIKKQYVRGSTLRVCLIT